MIPYHVACGPRALAAIAGRSEYVVAEELLAIQRARGRVTAPGTLPEDMLWWLSRRGYSIEPWDVDADCPAMSAEECAEHLRRTRPVTLSEIAPATVVERIGRQFPGVARETIEAAIAEVYGTVPTLRAWVSAHPAGTWLVHVDAHVLAVRDGRVIAGDDAELREYGGHPVQVVDRVWR